MLIIIAVPTTGHRQLARRARRFGVQRGRGHPEETGQEDGGQRRAGVGEDGGEERRHFGNCFVITQQENDQECQVRAREVKLESKGYNAVIKRSLSEKRNANLVDLC